MTSKTADLRSDAHELPSESQLNELRDAMARAIEQRSVPESERVFRLAHQILTDAQVFELRYRREKNIESQRRYWEIGLGVERLRGQWLIDTEKADLRYVRPKDTKFGAHTGLIMLDAAGRPPRIFIDRKKSQDLQAFAGLSEEQFKAVLADKTKMLTVAGVLRLYATPKPGHSIGVLGMKSTKRLLPLSAIRVDEQAQPLQADTVEPHSIDDIHEMPIDDPAAARIVLDAIVAMRLGKGDKLHAIRDATRQLDPITQGDALDYLSDVAISNIGLDPDAVQYALSHGQQLREQDRAAGGQAKRAEDPKTNLRDRKRSQDRKPCAWRDNLIDPQKLCDERFPEVKYVTPGIFPEGVILLASRPKLGKSWLLLQITTAIASGTVTLVASDHPVQGDVLYLALEDTPRRLQRRLTKYFGAQRETWPKRLALFTTWRRLDQGGLDDLREWCRSVAKPTLIAIDTLKKVRPPKRNKQSDYDADYEACEGLMEVAKEFPGLSIIVAHHDRKMDAEDVFDTVSGTLGLTGGVDTIALLKRSSKGTTLHAEGRDLVDAVEKAVSFDRETCRWMILGEAVEVQRSGERARVLAALVDLPDGLTVLEIQAAAQLHNRGATDMLLSRMAQDGDIYRVGRGRYSLTQSHAAGDMREKREIGKNDVHYGENPTKHHSARSHAQSNSPNSHSEINHSAAGAIEFLTWALKPGRRLVKDIEASARAEGLLSERQPIRNVKSFQLARETLGVVVERDGFGLGSKVYWRLPESPDQGPLGEIDGDPVPQAPERGPEGDGQ